MATLRSLLGRGYFPQELPPPFSTAQFAERIYRRVRHLPDPLAAPRPVAQLYRHSFVRGKGLQRRLGIPNPILRVGLCREGATNWQRLERASRRSPFSVSYPVAANAPARALVPAQGQRALPLLRAQARTGGRYMVVSDVSRFYHSIYTHSIPWALHSTTVL